MGATTAKKPDLTKLAALRAALAEAGVDGMLLPVTDEFQGEYSAAYARRVTWLTGFDGSAGSAIVLAEKAALFVDGRYTLQASTEVDAADYAVFNSAETTPAAWLKEQGEGLTLAYDPWLHTAKQLERLRESLDGKVALAPLTPNPVDALWPEQPMRPIGKLSVQPLDYAGVSLDAKLTQIAELLVTKGAAAYLVTLPENICWLLNIRGDDVPFNPLPLVYGLLHANGQFDLFAEMTRGSDEIAEHFGHHVAFVHPRDMADHLSTIAAFDRKIAYDPERTPDAFIPLIGERALAIDDPIIPLKAIKNEAEIAGIKRAHQIDGKALTRFLDWFHGLPDDAAPSEVEIATKLESFREESVDYRGPSFATIAGCGPNGAIVHYRASEKTARRVGKDDILLLDSGAQYPFGTTDVTRTLCRGTPSQRFKEHFTYVLKGHIALATARFPEGTTGSQLDALARQFLWANGLDYDHGTGHGVGCYLSVHEGPQRISKRGGDVPLKPGMILSNEPGYYKAGDYGIRIENLVLVVDKERGQDGKRYLGFETLTKVPIDLRLAEMKLLTTEERTWLEWYLQSITR